MALLILLSLAFVVGVGVVMGAFLGVTKLPGMMMQRKLEGRLQELAVPVDEVKAGKVLVKETSRGPLPALDRILNGTPRGSAIGRWLEQSGMKVTISGVLMMALASAALFG